MRTRWAGGVWAAMAIVACTLLLAGCAAASRPTAAAPTLPAPPTPRQGTGPDDIVYDPTQMADFACHGMDYTIMGRCAPEERATIEAEIRARASRGERIGVVELPGAGDDAVQAASGDDIVYDPTAMADFPCHAMASTIMGRCTPEEVEALRAQLLARREAGDDEPAPIALFTPGDRFEDAPELPAAAPSAQLDLADGARIEMDARPVMWTVGDAAFPGYAYNGSIPGPLLRVPQGATIDVDFTNRIDWDTTIHWHGLRHDSRMDGVPGVSQTVVRPGGSFRYRLRFPDAGLYWYHPHVREDIQQDAGMYGMMLVEPAEPHQWPPADVEEVLVLDDVLIEDGARVPYGLEHATFAIMGRFGNRMIANGRADYRLGVTQGDVVRFYIGNVANVRAFRLSFDGAPMKRVAGDMSRYLREEWVDEVVIAPAERTVVDVAFDEARAYRIVHDAAGAQHVVGTIDVAPASRPATAAREAFDALRVSSGVAVEVEPFRRLLEQPPDIELELTVDIPDLIAIGEPAEASPRAPDDHDEAGTALEATDDHDEAGEAADDHAAEGIEWEDDMLAVNRAATAEGVHWMIRDKASGAVNHEVAYGFTVGDRVRMRLHNLADSQHPMQHPIHFHGQRLLVLALDDVPETNPVWKDTVLVPAGSTMDLVMDVTNPGTWMVHCHIAEHLETGMMFQFTVTP